MNKKRGILLENNYMLRCKKGFSSSASDLTIFSVIYEGQVLNIERTSNWDVNITQVSKLFNKRWRNWERRNQSVINKFELLEGKSLIHRVGPKNKVQTYVSIKLALRILIDYDEIFSWHVFTEYQKNLQDKQSKDFMELELQNAYQRVELLEAENAKLKNKVMPIDLVDGKSLLYAYMCNNQVKFGTSFCNKTGQRLKSHKTISTWSCYRLCCLRSETSSTRSK